MNSVSKINVQIGSNAAQFAAGMGQASSAVGRFTASAGQMRMAVSQLAFAADDVVQVYGQAGVAGALRAASNNISVMAASLFGVKGLMIAVAASAATQLVMSFSKTKDAASEASEAIRQAQRALSEFQTQLSRGSAVPGQQRSLRQQLRDIGRESSLRSAVDRQMEGRAELDSLRQQLADENKRIADLRQVAASVQGDDATKAVQDEIAERKKAARAIRDQIREQEKLNEAIDLQIENLRHNIAPGVPGDRFGFFGDGAAAQGIRARLSLAAAQQRTFDPMRFFSSLPGAQTFGSSGAVSTINQAMIGPKNVENAQLAELKTIARSTSDAARILGGKLPVAVEVRL